MSPSRVAWAGWIGVALFVGTTILGGCQWSGYSHVANYISESLAAGTPHGAVLRWLGVVPAGVLFAAFAWGALRLVPPSPAARIGLHVLAVAYGLGTVVCAVFPCDFGCGRFSATVSVTQVIHNLAGLVTYLTVPAAILVLGVAARHWPDGRRVAAAGLGCGAVAAVGALLFLANYESPVAGLLQRLTEGAILVWIAFAAAWLHRLPAPSAPVRV
jgi:hypothetical protein